MKQTALEWLIQEYFGSEEKCSPLFRNKIKQAKEMEKQQIINAYDLGSLSEMQYPNPKTVIENGEQYYNETFKSE